MALRCLNLLRNIRCNNVILRFNLMSTLPTTEWKTNGVKKYKTEDNITYLEDPDCFGTLSGPKIVGEKLQDDGDIKEEEFLKNIPLKSQQLSTKQYADLIKQYLKFKRLKEAIDVLEIKMIKEDRVKPENYIYNILIGACAEVGYTKKAFKLFNDMKRRALKPTGDTYTCLFEACINSPWPAYGLKMATHLRNLMTEKGIEPNITNYNVMIKAFGRCSDLPMAFKIVDEMVSKKIKIRVHTFNHLLHACISDKGSGLKHALIVWRKMLKMRERPNVYSFNLMLKCVKDCNLGAKEDMLDIINIIQDHNMLVSPETKLLQVEGPQVYLPTNSSDEKNKESLKEQLSKGKSEFEKENNLKSESVKHLKENIGDQDHDLQENTSLAVSNENDNHIEFVQNYKKDLVTLTPERNVPNLLSKVVQIDQVLALQDVKSPQDKFAIIGGQDDFLKEMEVYSVKPDVKIFTQMLSLIDNSTKAENKLIENMRSLKIKADIDFYNMLIKKRCLRFDYDNAFEVTDLIEKENNLRKTHPLNKKNKLSLNIITYGVLAMACSTREKAERLLNEMRDKQLKINIEILGTLLKNGTRQMQFGYILYIMDLVKQENLRINTVFVKHLEAFNDKCTSILEKNEKESRESPIFSAAYKRFNSIYQNWLKEVNVEEALTPEHPWEQFKEPHPTSVQRENIVIKEPRQFYKRNRKFIAYAPKM